jgi:hypothetical protein
MDFVATAQADMDTSAAKVVAKAATKKSAAATAATIANTTAVTVTVTAGGTAGAAVATTVAKAAKASSTTKAAAKTAVKSKFKSKTKNKSKSSPSARRICKHDGCANFAQRKGLCRTHGGGAVCSVEGCAKAVKTAGLCHHHRSQRESPFGLVANGNGNADGGVAGGAFPSAAAAAPVTAVAGVVAAVPQQNLGRADLPSVMNTMPLPALVIPPPISQVWQTATAPDGRKYYWHTETREVSWTLPAATSSSTTTPPPTLNRLDAANIVQVGVTPDKRPEKKMSNGAKRKNSQRAGGGGGSSAANGDAAVTEPSKKKYRLEQTFDELVITRINDSQHYTPMMSPKPTAALASFLSPELASAAEFGNTAGGVVARGGRGGINRQPLFMITKAATRLRENDATDALVSLSNAGSASAVMIEETTTRSRENDAKDALMMMMSSSELLKTNTAYTSIREPAMELDL